MTHFETIACHYTTALKEACEAKRALLAGRVKLVELDAGLSEAIAEAKDDNGKPFHSNADSRKAALMNQPDRKALAGEVHTLELALLEAETRLDIAKVRWQTEKLIFAAERGLVSL